MEKETQTKQVTQTGPSYTATFVNEPNYTLIAKSLITIYNSGVKTTVDKK